MSPERSDEQVMAQLVAKLSELGRQDPLSALDLPASASRQQLRQQFLALTKIWHPSKFARRPSEVRRMATEVFLMLRKAYERAQASCAAEATASDEEAPGPGPSAVRVARIERPARTVGGVSARLAEARRRLRASERGASDAFENARTTKMPAFSRNSGDPDAQFRAAVTDLNQGRLDQARAALAKLIELYGPRRDWQMYLHYATGRCAHAAGRQADARKAYQMALALDPSFQAARHSLAILDEYTR